mmetsp:Transcript_26687/g.83684  ORF Transcript_26687/g.83684 Transcript_26687/m.83684 type:complete len:268 (+) Transcript_26687:678-1481(+)
MVPSHGLVRPARAPPLGRARGLAVVEGRHPPLLLLGHLEERVVHGQRLQEPLPYDHVKSCLAGHLADAPQDVRAEAILEPLAGLREQRNLRQLLAELRQVLDQALARPLDHLLVLRVICVAQASSHRHQMPQSGPCLRGPRAARGFHSPGEGHVLLHGVVELHRAIVQQCQEGRGHQSLGRAMQAADRVQPEGRAALSVCPAVGERQHAPPPPENDVGDSRNGTELPHLQARAPPDLRQGRPAHVHLLGRGHSPDAQELERLPPHQG